MYFKMLIKDYRRKKVITLVLFLFMLLAATLATGGSRMFLLLTGAMDSLFTKAHTPHFVQYHSGTYDEAYVTQWTEDSPYLKAWTVQDSISPLDVSLYLNNSKEELDQEHFGIYFTQQNDEIDILFDVNGEKLSVSEGNIAVPIYFMSRDGLEIGDTLTVTLEGYEKTFTISDFHRDSQYGSSMITPKRFILSEQDFQEMMDSGANSLSIFCFVFHDETESSKFAREFEVSDMPQNSFILDISLFRFLNSISDGIAIGLVLLCSVLLMLVTFLTLRYTILSTIEEDYREIGAMKAIGFQLSGIIRLYLFKYFNLMLPACILGFLLGQPLSGMLSANLLLNLGTPDNGLAGILIPTGSVILILAVTMLFCLLTLRRINKMTVMDAIRTGDMGETYQDKMLFSLSRQPVTGVNLFIGFRDILLKLKVYILLFIVFLLCTFICILPVNVRNTLNAPDVLKHFGFPVSDIMIMCVTNWQDNLDQLTDLLNEDPDVVRWTVNMEGYEYVKTEDGGKQKIRVIVGEQTQIELTYPLGTPPVLSNEIALSWLAAEDLQKKVGDSMIMEIDGEERYMLVTGIYADLSNGGRSVRACYEADISRFHYWQANIDVNGNVEEKTIRYGRQMTELSSSTMETIKDQFMGGISSQLTEISMMLAVVAILVSVLITALFIKMLTAKEVTQIAIMKSLGFTEQHIRTQYFVRIGFILLTGVICGTLTANILGEKIMNMICTMMGAFIMELIIKPVEVYMIYPALLFAAVCATVAASCRTIRKVSVSQINVE